MHQSIIIIIIIIKTLFSAHKGEARPKANLACSYKIIKELRYIIKKISMTKKLM